MSDKPESELRRVEGTVRKVERASDGTTKVEIETAGGKTSLLRFEGIADLLPADDVVATGVWDEASGSITIALDALVQRVEPGDAPHGTLGWLKQGLEGLGLAPVSPGAVIHAAADQASDPVLAFGAELAGDLGLTRTIRIVDPLALPPGGSDGLAAAWRLRRSLPRAAADKAGWKRGRDYRRSTGAVWEATRSETVIFPFSPAETWASMWSRVSGLPLTRFQPRDGVPPEARQAFTLARQIGVLAGSALPQLTAGTEREDAKTIRLVFNGQADGIVGLHRRNAFADAFAVLAAAKYLKSAAPLRPLAQLSWLPALASDPERATGPVVDAALARAEALIAKDDLFRMGARQLAREAQRIAETAALSEDVLNGFYGRDAVIEAAVKADGPEPFDIGEEEAKGFAAVRRALTANPAALGAAEPVLREAARRLDMSAWYGSDLERESGKGLGALTYQTDLVETVMAAGGTDEALWRVVDFECDFHGEKGRIYTGAVLGGRPRIPLLPDMRYETLCNARMGELLKDLGKAQRPSVPVITVRPKD
jgi:hypothetical protein